MSHGDGEVEKLVASHSSGGRRNREQEGGGGSEGTPKQVYNAFLEYLPSFRRRQCSLHQVQQDNVHIHGCTLFGSSNQE